MIKYIVKVVVLIMGVQSLLANLREQGIISGDIQIHYPVLQEKVISVVKSREFHDLVRKVKSSEVAEYVTPNDAQGAVPQQSDYNYQGRPNNSYSRRNYEQTTQRQNDYKTNRTQHKYNVSYENNRSMKQIRCLCHVVRAGETLSDLAQEYGVSWKVIKRANRIYNARNLQIGQNLIIPQRIGGLG